MSVAEKEVVTRASPCCSDEESDDEVRAGNASTAVPSGLAKLVDLASRMHACNQAR